MKTFRDIAAIKALLNSGDLTMKKLLGWSGFILVARDRGLIMVSDKRDTTPIPASEIALFLKFETTSPTESKGGYVAAFEPQNDDERKLLETAIETAGEFVDLIKPEANFWKPWRHGAPAGTVFKLDGTSLNRPFNGIESAFDDDMEPIELIVTREGENFVLTVQDA
ncbi:MAG: hypothetical protein AAB373_03430 [Patescibacteria group bacterium]